MLSILLIYCWYIDWKNPTKGTDLNRTWDTASPHAHPTVHTIRDVIDKLSKTVFYLFTTHPPKHKIDELNWTDRKIHWTLSWTSTSRTLFSASLLLAMPMTVSFGRMRSCQKLTFICMWQCLSIGGEISSSAQIKFPFFRNERHIVFPKMLAQNCRDFSNTNTMYNKVQNNSINQFS